MRGRKDRGARRAPRSCQRRVLLLACAVLVSSASLAVAGTVSVTDPLNGWNGGAALLPAPPGSYVEDGSVTVSASGEDVIFDAASGDLARSATGTNPIAALAVRYQVRRPDGSWSPSFGRGLSSSSWVDANVSGTRTYLVRATIDSAITSTTLRGVYAGSLIITLVQS